MSRLRPLSAAATRHSRKYALSRSLLSSLPSTHHSVTHRSPSHHHSVSTIYTSASIPSAPSLACRSCHSATTSSKSSTTTSTSTTWMPSLSMSVPQQDRTVDPFRLVSDDLSVMTRSIRDTVSVLQHPALDRAASHLLSLHGKRIRPIIVLLMAHATSAISSSTPSLSMEQPFPSQLRLAEITELIHAASLLHDDVIDVADTRRGVMSVNSLFGNQLAVLAGDFLLARASVALARLRDCDVVELLSTVIEHLVRGEVIQMRSSSSSNSQAPIYKSPIRTSAISSMKLFSMSASTSAASSSSSSPSSSSTSTTENDEHFEQEDSDSIQTQEEENNSTTLNGGIGDTSSNQDWFHHPTSPFDTYLSKTFFKTASLVANSCRAVSMLANHPPHVSNAAFSFGEGIGMAFQLVDDMLDLTSSSSILGKPVLNDLRQGVITAPVLFAAEKFPQLNTMIDRQFSHDGDLDVVVDLVHQAQGVEKTRILAQQYAQRAVTAIVDVLPPSEHRSALVNLADFVLTRQS